VHPDDLLESRPLAAGEYGLAVRILDVARRPELIRVGGTGLLPGSVTVGRAPDDRGEPGPVLGLGHARVVESDLQGGRLAVRGVLVAHRDGGAVLEELVEWHALGILVQRGAVLGPFLESQRRGPHLLRGAFDGGDLSGVLVLGRAPSGVRQGLRRDDLLAAGVASQRVSEGAGRERLRPGGGSGECGPCAEGHCRGQHTDGLGKVLHESPFSWGDLSYRPPHVTLLCVMQRTTNTTRASCAVQPVPWPIGLTDTDMHSCRRALPAAETAGPSRV